MYAALDSEMACTNIGIIATLHFISIAIHSRAGWLVGLLEREREGIIKWYAK